MNLIFVKSYTQYLMRHLNDINWPPTMFQELCEALGWKMTGDVPLLEQGRTSTWEKRETDVVDAQP